MKLKSFEINGKSMKDFRNLTFTLGKQLVNTIKQLADFSLMEHRCLTDLTNINELFVLCKPSLCKFTL